MSASTLPLMSVEPPIYSHVLCILGSLGGGSQPGCHMVVMIFFWSQELYHGDDDCD